jgi:hypothetical protein
LFLKKPVTIFFFFLKKFDSTRVDKIKKFGAHQELFIVENGFGIPKSLFIAETQFEQ